ncbi:translational GTPase TypA [Magnetococcales bacterium HHB-1]
MIPSLRNIAIIAHVDHGKTTLVDQLLRQSGTLDQRKAMPDRVMDSNDLERERGITILSKNTAIQWKEWRINIVDTPGHADFGGEVERVLSMVDSVLLLVDAVEGPMPQTRFVTQKAFELGFNPIVVINKIDRHGSRPDWVIDQTFDLFDSLGASDEQLDFPVVYASALQGWASLDGDQPEENMDALFQAIVEHTPPPDVDPHGPLQFRVSALDYSSYVGQIGVGRIKRGKLRVNQSVMLIDREGNTRRVRILQVFHFMGLQRVEISEAVAGDIIAFTGVENLNISDTLCDPEHIEALPALAVDEPTIRMTFQVNTSPLSGQEGRFLTSRQIRERLDRELMYNVALRVDDTDDPDKFRVSGRGELHLSVLIETMRREGYELGVSRPEVIIKEVDGQKMEPYELLTVDVEEQHQGAVMEVLGARKGELINMTHGQGHGWVRLEYRIPARGLIGFLTEFRTLTSGTGLLHHVFDAYGPYLRESLAQRNHGVLVSKEQGKAVAYALFNLQGRGTLFVSSGEMLYEGMIVGINKRDNDLVVNPLKGKQLTNIRASGSDEAVILTPPLKLSLEQALEFIDDDELVEVTPKTIRLRKKLLKEHERKKDMRQKKKGV